MAISVDPATKVISIPQADLTHISGQVYELDADTFRLELKDWEDSEQGMTMQDTHRHNTEVVLAGVTYSRFIEIINGYTLTFEDGQYAVNVVGANTNFADVTNVNQVSLRTANSAGLVTVASTTPALTAQNIADLADQVWRELIADHSGVSGSFAEAWEQVQLVLTGTWEIDSDNYQMIFYESDGATPLFTFNLFGLTGQPAFSNVFKRERV